MSSSSGVTSKSPASILIFISLGVGIILINVIAIISLRYYWRRRRTYRIPNEIGEDMSAVSLNPQNAHPRHIHRQGTHAHLYPYGIGANGSRRDPRQKKSLKLMTKEQIDEKFPTCAFKEARTKSKLLAYHQFSEKDLNTIEDRNDCDSQNKSSSTSISTSPETSSKPCFSNNNQITKSLKDNTKELTTVLTSASDDDNEGKDDHHSSCSVPPSTLRRSFFQTFGIKHQQNRHSSASLMLVDQGNNPEIPNNHPHSKRFSTIPTYNIHTLNTTSWLSNDAAASNFSSKKGNTRLVNPNTDPNSINFSNQYSFDQPASFNNEKPRINTQDQNKRENDENDLCDLDSTTRQNQNDELLNNDLSTCAICIDDMEDEDLVRGLTCGHIFHSECIEPWLLKRRACCPLCKYDYYAPKPIDPLGPDPILESLNGSRNGRLRRNHNRQGERRYVSTPILNSTSQGSDINNDSSTTDTYDSLQYEINRRDRSLRRSLTRSERNYENLQQQNRSNQSNNSDYEEDDDDNYSRHDRNIRSTMGFYQNNNNAASSFSLESSYRALNRLWASRSTSRLNLNHANNSNRTVSTPLPENNSSRLDINTTTVTEIPEEEASLPSSGPSYPSFQSNVNTPLSETDQQSPTIMLQSLPSARIRPVRNSQQF